MDGATSFYLGSWDYAAFFAYLVVLSGIGWWAGRKEKLDADDYLLAGRTLPWYVVGGSFIASNISSEHFIGMVGAATVYGICVAMAEWGNVLSFACIGLSYFGKYGSRRQRPASHSGQLVRWT